MTAISLKFPATKLLGVLNLQCGFDSLIGVLEWPIIQNPWKDNDGEEYYFIKKLNDVMQRHEILEIPEGNTQR